MSVQAITWALSQRCGDTLSKFVLMTLADGEDMESNVAVDLAALAAVTEAPEDDVLDALGRLDRAGLIQWSGASARLAFRHPITTTMSPQRARIYERDGFACVYCGADGDLTLDHIIPRSRGGSDDDDNLATACRRCNCRKGARTPLEWRSQK